MSQQIKIRCAVCRGGTSKALFFMENDLPQDQNLRERIILATFGSPDVRQINGMGGSDITTSKVAIIGPSTRPDADVDYTFGQVMLNRAEISWQGNCGNISSAVGPFAVDEGLVRPTYPKTVVRIHNTNTQKILVSTFDVEDGKACVEGDFVIPGVPGTGSKIELNFAGTAGSATGKLLPTGNVTDFVEIEGIGKIEISIVDVANPVVFVRAKDIGLTGKENRPWLLAHPDVLELLEKIRSAGAELSGIVKDRRNATKEAPLAPQMSIVAPSEDYEDYATGKKFKGEDVSFLARVMFNQMPVDAYTGTGSFCTSAACMIPGTIVNQYASAKTLKTGHVVIGHARGCMELDAEVVVKDGKCELTKAVLNRTARRLMDAFVYVKKSVLADK